MVLSRLWRIMQAVWLWGVMLGYPRLRVGQVVPACRMMTTQGETTMDILLRRGVVVLAFYYADYTPG